MGRYDVTVRGKERLWVVRRDFRDDTLDLDDEKAKMDRDLVAASNHTKHNLAPDSDLKVVWKEGQKGRIGEMIDHDIDAPTDAPHSRKGVVISTTNLIISGADILFLLFTCMTEYFCNLMLYYF